MRLFRWVLVFLIAVFFVWFVSFGPLRLVEKTESGDFCGRCHVMELQTEAWKVSSHRLFKCVDCHLPNENFFLHYWWKALDGLKDVIVFYSGRVPEEIRASEHARKVISENCFRCHYYTVSRLDFEGRYCWECHRILIHKIQLLKKEEQF